MSDYGDDYDEDYGDYGGDEWIYVEDEYMQADDLAEHAVASPPPIVYDDDKLAEWDRFDYFNDLEYNDEPYDDGNFQTHNEATGQPAIGQKRKRGPVASMSVKKQKLAKDRVPSGQDAARLTHSPIVWRAQADRGAKARILPEDAQPYAILKDWRERLTEAPAWIQKPTQTPEVAASPTLKAHVDDGEQDKEPDLEEDDLEEDEAEGDNPSIGDIDSAALMAALQSRLGSTGGPLSGMDPQQLLQFALRMANNQEAGDDIAGELADEMLNQEGDDDEDEEEVEANLLSWVSKQRDSSKVETPHKGTDKKSAASAPSESSDAIHLPVTRNTLSRDETMTDGSLDVEQTPRTLEIKQTSRKRKVQSPADTPAASPKKRATKPSDPPPPKTTRSGRAKRRAV